MIDAFVERAAAAPAVRPERPPEPEPLFQFDQECFGPGGRCQKTVVLTDDVEDALTDARITCDPDVVEDLGRWR